MTDAAAPRSGPPRPVRPLLARIDAGQSIVGDGRWTIVSAILAFILAMPILAILWIAAAGDDGAWSHLIRTVLPMALLNTLALMFGACAGALLIGTAAAWLVTMHRFPGRAVADKLLVLPLAMPLYVIAYAYVEFLDYAGPVQSALRASFGWSAAGDYWFPGVRSLGGAIAMFSLALYPYVYLTARASFEQQSACVLEVARTLGRTAGRTFWEIALPLARPALAAGAALVAMESMNDLGAVQYLGVETLSASIYATWLQRGSLPGAAQLAVVLLGLVAALLLAERALRGGGSTQATTGRHRAIPFEDLCGWQGWAALVAALLPMALGFALPFLVIAIQAVAHFDRSASAGLAHAALNSLTLAGIVAAVALATALAVAYGVRISRGVVTRAASQIASFGYALPGAVLAIGLIAPLAAFDNGVDAWMRGAFGVSTGLLLSGSLFAVTLALVIRFLAVAIGSVEAGLQRISPNLDAAARTLGAGGAMTLLRVHLPILAPALGAAALLVFVDAMKELPATLLLRPFNFETLATYVYGLTAAEAFEEAALGAVAIVLVGLAPVIWLHKAIAEGRAGSGGG
ncbi:MAG: ABC transporter permease [Hyphomicrobium sp.]